MYICLFLPMERHASGHRLAIMLLVPSLHIEQNLITVVTALQDNMDVLMMKHKGNWHNDD